MKTVEEFLKEEGFVFTNKKGGEKSYPASYILSLMKKYTEQPEEDSVVCSTKNYLNCKHWRDRSTGCNGCHFRFVLNETI